MPRHRSFCGAWVRRWTAHRKFSSRAGPTASTTNVILNNDHTQELNSRPERAWASVHEVHRATHNVVRLHLRVDEAHADAFRFRPGQWVDVWLPGVRQIGGFSMVSSPSELPFFALAVKASPFPPARWLAEEARPGHRLQCRAGGSFHWMAQDAHEGLQANRLLLVAGGVGINPLYAMVRDLALLLDQTPPSVPSPIPSAATASTLASSSSSSSSLAASSSSSSSLTAAAAPSPRLRSEINVRIAVLYSCKTPADLLFLQEMERIAAKYPNHLKITPTITSAAESSDEVGPVGHKRWAGRKGRIDEAAIRDALGFLDVPGEDRVEAPLLLNSFVCGPPAFSDRYETDLLRCGLDPDQVCVERWW